MACAFCAEGHFSGDGVKQSAAIIPLNGRSVIPLFGAGIRPYVSHCFGDGECFFLVNVYSSEEITFRWTALPGSHLCGMECSFSVQSVFINVDVVCREMNKATLHKIFGDNRTIVIHGLRCLPGQCSVMFVYLTVTRDMTCLMKHVHLLFRTCSLVKCTGHSNVVWSQELVSIGCVHEILSDADTSDPPSGFILIIVQFIL